MDNVDTLRLTAACDWVMELPFEMTARGIPLLMSPGLMAVLLVFAYERADFARMTDCVELVLEFEERQDDELGPDRFLACCIAAYEHDPEQTGTVVQLSDFLKRRQLPDQTSS